MGNAYEAESKSSQSDELAQHTHDDDVLTLLPSLLDGPEDVRLAERLVCDEQVALEQELARPSRQLGPRLASVAEGFTEPAPIVLTVAPWPQTPQPRSRSPLVAPPPLQALPEEAELCSRVVGSTPQELHGELSATLGTVAQSAVAVMAEASRIQAQFGAEWQQQITAAHAEIDEHSRRSLQCVGSAREMGLGALASERARTEQQLADGHAAVSANLTMVHRTATEAISQQRWRMRAALESRGAGFAPRTINLLAPELRVVLRGHRERAREQLSDDTASHEREQRGLVEANLSYSFSMRDAKEPRLALYHEVCAGIIKEQEPGLASVLIDEAADALLADCEAQLETRSRDLADALVEPRLEALEAMCSDGEAFLDSELANAKNSLDLALEASRVRLEEEAKEVEASIETQYDETVSALEHDASQAHESVDERAADVDAALGHASSVTEDVIVTRVDALQMQLRELEGMLLPMDAVRPWVASELQALQAELDALRNAQGATLWSATEALSESVAQLGDALTTVASSFETEAEELVGQTIDATREYLESLLGAFEQGGSEDGARLGEVPRTVLPIAESLVPEAEATWQEELQSLRSETLAGLEHQVAALGWSDFGPVIERALEYQAPAAVIEAENSVNGVSSHLHNELTSTVYVDDSVVCAALRNLSPGEIAFLKARYDSVYQNRSNQNSARNEKCNWVSPLYFDIWDGTSGDDYHAAIAYLEHDRKTAQSYEVKAATSFLWNDDEERIEQLLVSMSDAELDALGEEDKQRIRDSAFDWGSGSDRSLYETLLNTSIDRETRFIHADAIRIARETRWRVFGDEEVVENILARYDDDSARALLRSSFEHRTDEPLEVAVSSLVAFGAVDLVVEYAQAERDHDRIRMAKLVKAGHGLGTDEAALASALEDPEFAARLEAEPDPAVREAMIVERVARLDVIIREMKAPKVWGAAATSVADYLDSELGTESVSWADVVRGGLSSSQLEAVNAERMMAEELIRTGKCEPDLMIRAAVQGAGTNVELLTKALQNRSRAELETIRLDYLRHWREVCWRWPDDELGFLESGQPSGRLDRELSGQDWYQVKLMLLGRPETPAILRQHELLALQYNQDGAVLSWLRKSRVTKLEHALRLVPNVRIAVGAAELTADKKRDLEDLKSRQEKVYDKLKAKDPRLLDMPFSELRMHPDPEIRALATELDLNGQSLVADADAYGEAVDKVVDMTVLIAEAVVSAAVSVLTAGAGTPWTVVVCAELAIAAGGIAAKAALKGQRYWSSKEIGIDSALAIASAAGTAVKPQLKILSDRAGDVVQVLVAQGVPVPMARSAAKALVKASAREDLTKRLAELGLKRMRAEGPVIGALMTTEKVALKALSEAGIATNILLNLALDPNVEIEEGIWFVIAALATGHGADQVGASIGDVMAKKLGENHPVIGLAAKIASSSAARVAFAKVFDSGLMSKGAAQAIENIPVAVLEEQLHRIASVLGLSADAQQSTTETTEGAREEEEAQ